MFQRIWSLLLCLVLLLGNVPVVSAEGENPAVIDQVAEDQSAADTVAALIAALPTLEEIQAKSQEEQAAACAQVQSAYSAYEQLTEAQKALLPPAEETFKPYFDWINNQTQEAAGETSGACGNGVQWSYTNSTLTISSTGTGTGVMNNFSSYSTTPWATKVNVTTKIVIESGVTAIGDYAFKDFKNVTTVEIADTVQHRQL